jgi:hypothetical protein
MPKLRYIIWWGNNTCNLANFSAATKANCRGLIFFCFIILLFFLHIVLKVEILRFEADDGKSSSSGASDVGPAVADLEDFLDVLLLQNSSRLAEFLAIHSAETVDIKKERRNRGSKIKTFL